MGVLFAHYQGQSSSLYQQQHRYQENWLDKPI